VDAEFAQDICDVVSHGVDGDEQFFAMTSSMTAPEHLQHPSSRAVSRWSFAPASCAVAQETRELIERMTIRLGPDRTALKTSSMGRSC